jgi:hypothetical protein
MKYKNYVDFSYYIKKVVLIIFQITITERPYYNFHFKKAEGQNPGSRGYGCRHRLDRKDFLEICGDESMLSKFT